MECQTSVIVGVVAIAENWLLVSIWYFELLVCFGFVMFNYHTMYTFFLLTFALKVEMRIVREPLFSLKIIQQFPT